MKVSVTGATGFIGRHVIAELDRRGISATLLSRSASALSIYAEKHSVATFDLNAPSPDTFDAIGRPDVLIHLAWDGLPNYQSPHHFEDELPAQYRFLERAIAGGLANLFVTGTCFEYGMQSGPLHEELVARPISQYGLAKNALRVRLQDLQGSVPFGLTWARLFYIYGAGQAATALYSLVRAAVERGDRSFNMSGGDQQRDYLPVEEVARDIVTLALRGRNNGVVNVCSGVPISIRQLVEGWISENGWSIELNLGYYPYPDYEPMAFWGNREKLDRCLHSGAAA